MVTLGENLAISQSSILLPQFRCRASSQGRHSLPRYQIYSAASTDHTSICFLRTRSDPLVLSRPIHAEQQHHKGLFGGIRTSVVPEFEAQKNLTVNAEDEAIGSTDGGDYIAGGGGESGGGGNNWGNNSNEGEGQSDESKDSNGDKGKKLGMSMSQKLTLGYAALVGLGGVMGYLKSGSRKSLMAGGLSALLLYYVYTQLPTSPVFASSLGLGLSAALLAVMGSRFKNSGKVFPAGVVSFVSLVMTGGYLHGIMRSMH